MADAVLLKRDGSPAAIRSTSAGDWFRSFSLGDTPTRRAQLAQLAIDNAGTGPWSIVEGTKAQYQQARAIEYAVEIAAAATQATQKKANYASFRTKFGTLMRSPQVGNILASEGQSPITVAELLAFEEIILGG